MIDIQHLSGLPAEVKIKTGILKFDDEPAGLYIAAEDREAYRLALLTALGALDEIEIAPTQRSMLRSLYEQFREAMFLVEPEAR